MPAERRSSLHEWINSVGIIITFAIAGFSAWVSWTTYQLKKEDILAVATYDNSCPANYVNFQAYGSTIVDGSLGLCWNVTIANKSEDKLSIIGAFVYRVGKGGSLDADYIPGFHFTEEMNGNSLEFPVVLDGGAARRFRVRVCAADRAASALAAV